MAANSKLGIGFEFGEKPTNKIRIITVCGEIDNFLISIRVVNRVQNPYNKPDIFWLEIDLELEFWCLEN